MVSRIQQALKQRKPFSSLRHEVMVSVARTSAVLSHSFEQALKAHGITPTQYNVLRILRGAGPEGLCRYEIGDRLITPVPDVSRLLDRMAAAGLILRERALSDRRLVVACITPKGLATLEALDVPSREIIDAQMKHMSDEQLLTLRDLLDLARNEG
jgi:DNA-binding MarR family transcriptional regulator